MEATTAFETNYFDFNNHIGNCFANYYMFLLDFFVHFIG